MSLKGCQANNLKNIDVKFPIGVFTCVTGVSRLGQKLAAAGHPLPAARPETLSQPRARGQGERDPGLEHIDRVIDIDQSPIGRTPRSNPATYTGLFTHIRDLFAQVPEARLRGYSPAGSASMSRAAAARPARATA